ncbi:hypothetical protein O181_022273 [Austropuccinia psidii MF-1]|uniref:CFA20 domain-containing protein n=1 Tax=Austropuccinia psidii MF-1 TaxID=1389203 RepID=A0A9Q3GW68_9BASI|nr:hypothetical protein [Austropuccinia psidii MF-1]
MKVIYDDAIQQSPLVIFSSLPISSPFDHASLSIDPQLSSDSFIALLDDTTNRVARSSSDQPLIYYHPSHSPSPQELKKPHPSNLLGSQDPLCPIRSVVLHLQAPNCLNTFIRFPPLDKSCLYNTVLGVQLPFLHLQIKPLNHTFMIEVGVTDQAGDRIVIRCSNFQTEARQYSRPKSSPQLIHIPIVFPSPKSPAQTSWTDLLIPLANLIPSKYQSTDFIKVHANIRLRRIYFTIDGKQPTLDSNRDRNQYDEDVKQVIQTEDSNIQSITSLFRPELLLFQGHQSADD